MSSKLCCTADSRAFSPALPCPRRIQLSAIEPTGGQDSTFTSTKTEDLQDLRRIFADANIDDDGRKTLNSASSTGSSRTARIANFLRRKLSKDKTKSKSGLQAETQYLKRLKQDIRKNLLSNQRPESGGYDTDAPELEDIDEIALAELGVNRPRGGHRRPGLQNLQWAATAPDRYGLFSTSLSADAQHDGRVLRRSVSTGSIYSWPIRSNLQALRLPSFAVSTTSKGWKTSVMESLHITSRSVSSGFGSADVPDNWGKIVPGTETSSIYSPLVQTPRATPGDSRSHSDLTGAMDGPTDEPQRLQRARALSVRHNASGLMASAIMHDRDEKAALLLPGHKDQVNQIGARERSHSFSRPRTLPTAGESTNLESTICPIPDIGLDRRSRSAVHVKPEFSTPVFSETPLSLPAEQRAKNRAPSVALDPFALAPRRSISRKPSSTPVFQLNDVPAELPSEPSMSTLPVPSPFALESTETHSAEDDFENPNVDLGAWARYPSHTRDIRTGSAGPADNVKTRDFAYFPSATVIVEASSGEEDANGKQTKRKKKKQRARTGIPKSRSMVFAKEFIKNYAKHLWAPNVEFLKHGHGHRSSISTGGTLEHPELEILPPVFAPTPIAENPNPIEDITYLSYDLRTSEGIEMQVLTPKQTSMARRASLSVRRLSTIGSGVDGADDENLLDVDALRRARRSISSPSLALSGLESISNQQNAQFWARMYESCVDLPRFSVSADQSVPHSRQHSRQVSLSLSEPRSSSDSQDATITQYVPLLIDEILATEQPSMDDQKDGDSSTDTDLQDNDLHSRNMLAFLSRTGSPSSQSLPARLGHAKKESIMSMESIRASSMDLWQLLKETEETERQKLMGLMEVATFSVDVGGQA